jgi:hypothetical protein
MIDDPRSYSSVDLADPRKLREYLAVMVEDSAYWRGLKAEEYPQDERNVASWVALVVAAREVAALPDDDPRLVHIARFWAAPPPDSRYLEE